MISRSTDMAGAYQNLNGLHDLSTPLSGMVCHPWSSTCYVQPIYIKFEISTHHTDMTGDTKCRKWGGLG